MKRPGITIGHPMDHRIFPKGFEVKFSFSILLLYPVFPFYLSTYISGGKLKKDGGQSMDMKLGRVPGLHPHIEQPDVIIFQYFFVKRLFTYLNLGGKAGGQKGGKAEEAEEQIFDHVPI